MQASASSAAAALRACSRQLKRRESVLRAVPARCRGSVTSLARATRYCGGWDSVVRHRLEAFGDVTFSAFGRAQLAGVVSQDPAARGPFGLHRLPTLSVSVHRAKHGIDIQTTHRLNRSMSLSAPPRSQTADAGILICTECRLDIAMILYRFCYVNRPPGIRVPGSSRWDGGIRLFAQTETASNLH